MKNFTSYLKKAFGITLVLIVLCGVAYPLVMTGAGQLLFKKQANGSMIEINGKKVGSELIGQEFEGEQYFQGRVSSVNYNVYSEKEKEDGTYTGPASGSYNYGSTTEELQTRVEKDMKAFQKKYENATGKELEGEVPADLLTASGSGLDPHISPASAKVQIPIVVANSGLSEEEVETIVEENTEHKFLGIFGEEKVNVLKCNIEIAEKMGVTLDE